MNTKSVRRKNDFYPTPLSVVEHFLDNYDLGGTNINILEPCAGSGNFIKVLQERGYNNITACEIRKEETKNLEALVGSKNVFIKDFLESEFSQESYDVVITNPPFSLAMEFLYKSLMHIKEEGKVIMLLRLGFLASKKTV